MTKDSPIAIVLLSILVLGVGFAILVLAEDDSANIEKEKTLKTNKGASRFQGDTISFDLGPQITNIRSEGLGSSEIITLEYNKKPVEIVTWPKNEDTYLDLKKDYGEPDREIFSKTKPIYLYRGRQLLFQTSKSNVSLQTDRPSSLLPLAESAGDGGN